MAQLKNILGVVFFVLTLISCTDTGWEDTRMTPAGPTPAEPTSMIEADLRHDVDSSRIERVRDNMAAKIDFNVIEDGEVKNVVSFSENPTMTAFINLEKDNYTITEDLIEPEVVDAKVIRNYEPSHVADGGYEEKDTVVIYLNDGQVIKTPVIIMTYGVEFEGKCHCFGSDTLLNARLVSARNVSSRATRAAYVQSVLNTEYTVELEFAEKNTQRDSTFTVSLRGYATRNLIAEDEIESVTVGNKNREVIDANTERVSFDEITTMKSGEIVKVSKSMVLNREFKGIDAYNKNVSSFAYAFANSNGLKNGAEATVREQDNWTVLGRTDNYSANIKNAVASEDVTTSYSLYHERATYKDAYVTVEFGYESINVSETETKVVNVNSDKSGFDKALLNNEVRTVYLGYTQNLAEVVNLYKTAKAVSGYSFANGKLVVNNNTVVATVDFITTFNTGEKETETMSKTFDRSLTCTSNWTSNEANASQSTGAANVSLKSDNRTDGFWSYTVETRTIGTTAKLSGSVHNNSWSSVEPNDIKITREGKTYSFGKTAFAAVENGATVTKKSENDESETYSYTDKINVTFGANTKSSTANGTIIVAKEVKGDFPSEWGKFVRAKATVTVNENTNDWYYVWSLHFENGTLPVIINKSANSANVNQDYYQNKVDARFNSGSYVNGTWVNSIASDEANYMLWMSENSSAYKMMVYPTATMWNWNNGKNSVFTDKFTFSIENGGKTLVVKKDGKVFASYRASVR